MMWNYPRPGWSQTSSVVQTCLSSVWDGRTTINFVYAQTTKYFESMNFNLLLVLVSHQMLVLSMTDLLTALGG